MQWTQGGQPQEEPFLAEPHVLQPFVLGAAGRYSTGQDFRNRL